MFFSTSCTDTAVVVKPTFTQKMFTALKLEAVIFDSSSRADKCFHQYNNHVVPLAHYS